MLTVAYQGNRTIALQASRAVPRCLLESSTRTAQRRTLPWPTRPLSPTSRPDGVRE